MTAFESLHPAIQYHIVNSLGWASLRPMQERSIEPLVAGRHALIIAPTAGGKTEAAFFPILSKMLAEEWNGTTVLYVCPLKALLNDLEHRLSRYAGYVGRRVQLWHGDVSNSVKARVPSERPDVILTTPESLEVMLVSRDPARREMLRDVRVVIVDELHAFAGDDRGWHLLAVLERIARLSGRTLQRIGLSATIGNPKDLLAWLIGSNGGEGDVIAPLDASAVDADVEIDYVGNLENAALVISKLHRGEKRLVFCDSRARVEELAARVRNLGISTFVSHGSLALEERQQAEQAFAEARNCVIVATSTLELGVDVGDLDRVIQIDAPATVASFLQRSGRTGRRPGSRRNMLLLTTTPDAMLRAAALVRLWRGGYTEPLVPPPLPFHLFAQQTLALILQFGRIGRSAIKGAMGGVPLAGGISNSDQDAILEHMIESAILVEDAGLLLMGPNGEETYGHRNFVDVFAIFSSPPFFTVMHGRAEIGQVHEQSLFTSREGAPIVLTLAGRHWKVEAIEWDRRTISVSPAQEVGRSRWLGLGMPSRFEHAQSAAAVLAGEDPDCRLTRRAGESLAEARREHPFVRPGQTTIVMNERGVLWWTFAGIRANTQLAGLQEAASCPWKGEGNHVVVLSEPADAEVIDDRLREAGVESVPIAVDSRIRDGVKFSECVPPQLIDRMLQARWRDPPALRWVESAPRNVVIERE